MTSEPRNEQAGTAGLVLLDVVLALAVVALTAAILYPMISSRSGLADVRAQAERVAAVLRHARTDAIRLRRAIDVTIDPAARLVAGAGRTSTIAADVAVEWTASDQCPVRNGRRLLRFVADGKSCGGLLRLSAAGHRVDVRVAWLTGLVDVTARKIDR